MTAAAIELGNNSAYQEKLASLLRGREPLDVLAATPDALGGLLARRSTAFLQRRPFPGKWTPTEIIGHLCDADILYGWRVRLILCEDAPPITPIDQDRWVAAQRYNGRDAFELLDEFRALRRIMLGLWRRLTPADMARSARHPERGDESLALMLKMHAGHDLSHIDQITRYLAALDA